MLFKTMYNYCNNLHVCFCRKDQYEKKLQEIQAMIAESEQEKQQEEQQEESGEH